MFKKSLITVMLAVFIIFAASLEQANSLPVNDGMAPVVTNLYVNPGGLGDALIFGYYNVKGGNLNFLRIVNTSTDKGIGGKIRFREGKDSNEVLDFFVCLSAGDQWSAWIVDGGLGQPAILFYYDNDTPTYPDPQRDNNAANNMLATESFIAGIPATVTKDDTKEGYFEFIANTAWADRPGAEKTVKTPEQCRAKVLGTSGSDAPNTLFGNHYIFDIANGGTYAYNAVALAEFLNAHVQGSLATDSDPRLDANLNAVNFVLTKSVQYATYDLEFNGGTTIINTFPTKMLTSGPPFDVDDKNKMLRCQTVNLKIWNDKEESPTTTEGVSPRPREEQFQKCNEVSLVVVGTGETPALPSGLVDITLPNAGFTLGWVSEDFVTGFPTRETCVGGVCAQGLPVISYELQGFINGYFTQMLPLRYETKYYYEVPE
jgi:hypothetical protein